MRRVGVALSRPSNPACRKTITSSNDSSSETFDFLDSHLQTDGPFWILSFGEVLHDPSHRVEPNLRLARRWASENVELCASMETDFHKARAKKLARLRSREV